MRYRRGLGLLQLRCNCSCWEGWKRELLSGRRGGGCSGLLGHGELGRGGKGRRLSGHLLRVLQEREPGYEENDGEEKQGAAGEAAVPRF
jgi:hypothetical protein